MWNYVRLHRVTAKKAAIFEVLKYFPVVQTTEQASVVVTFETCIREVLVCISART